MNKSHNEFIEDVKHASALPLQKVATRGLDEVLEGQIKVLTEFLNLDDVSKQEGVKE